MPFGREERAGGKGGGAETEPPHGGGPVSAATRGGGATQSRTGAGLPLLPWLISEYIFSGLKNSPPSSGFPSLSQNLWPNATASSCDWTSGFP